MQYLNRPHKNKIQPVQAKSCDDGFQLEDRRASSVLQRKQAAALASKEFSETVVQKKENSTGLPDRLKSGIENLSGHAMDDVKVRYNSSQTAQLNAHAYAQGNQIHLAPEQEKHLPHEAWHVVQQKQGRVKPTMQLKGKVNVNDDNGLEKEADVMGIKALQMKINPSTGTGAQKGINGSLSFDTSSSTTIQRVVGKGLKPGTKVRISAGGRSLGQQAIIQSLQASGYKVIVAGKKSATSFQFSELTEVPMIEDEAEADEAVAPVVHHEPVHEVIAAAAPQQEMVDAHIAVEAVPAAEVTLEAQIESILSGDWNSHGLVESIGTQPWDTIKAAWDAIDAGDNEALKRKKSKFTLVKLRGTPYQAEDDAVDSYEGWSDNFMATQEGHMWGTETEGGGISVKLKLAHRGRGADKKVALKEALNFFKRTPLIETDGYNLALDNVMDKIDALLRGGTISLPIEAASKAISGRLTSVTDKARILTQEGRSADNWPQLRVAGGRLAVKKGTDLNLARFNQYFDTIGVQNIATHQKPQHVTTSGKNESRKAMATELKDTAASLDLGTSGKAALSGKPKTSIEFLRHSGMNEEEVRHLEKTGADIRNSLRGKLPEGTRFADEMLHAIILPKTGAPREIGGYTLATPMTNAFPLLNKGAGSVSVLREHR